MKYIIPSTPIMAFLFVFFVGLFLPASLPAAEPGNAQWEITADKITKYEDPPSIVAEGNVILEKRASAPPPSDALSSGSKGLPGKQKEVQASGPGVETEAQKLTTVKADWIAYDVNRGEVKARGNLLVDMGTDQLTADSGRVDLENATGVFENAVIVGQEEKIHLEGRLIEKTGDLTYHIKDGWLVTCKLRNGETPPWSFGASDVEITDGGYAFLKHATFRIKDVPVLYSPIMLLPAKRKRQTGFLFPSILTSSRDGLSVETPFFVNLSPNTDITLFPRYFANRGLMNGAEFRYVLGETDKGMLMGNYLSDALSDPSEVAYYQDGQFTHTNSDRYWIRGKADQDIGKWVTRLDMDIVSDLDYLREFNSGATSFSSSQDKFFNTFGRGFVDKANQYRDNTLSVLRSWENGTSLQGELLAVNDVSMQTYTADDPSRIWKLPSLTYSGLLPIYNIGGPDFSWEANYVNFWREKGVGAQRLDLSPMVTAAVPLNPYLETTVSGGVRDTLYMIQGNGASEWEDSDSKNRYLYNLGGEIGTTLMHDFTVNMGEVNAWSHMLRPFIAYSYTSIPNKKVLPQFDIIDTLEEQNAIYYGINNFFTIHGEHNGHQYDRDYAFLKIKQGYDLQSEEQDTPLTPVEIKTGFFPMESVRLMYTSNIDVYGDGVFLHALEADSFSERGDLLSLDYRYNSLTDVNSVSGGVWYLLPYNFSAGYSLQRALETHETIEERIRLRYTQPCWSVEVSSNSTVGDQTFMLTFRLANIGNAFGVDVPGL